MGKLTYEWKSEGRVEEQSKRGRGGGCTIAETPLKLLCFPSFLFLLLLLPAFLLLRHTRGTCVSLLMQTFTSWKIKQPASALARKNPDTPASCFSFSDLPVSPCLLSRSPLFFPPYPPSVDSYDKEDDGLCLSLFRRRRCSLVCLLNPLRLVSGRGRRTRKSRRRPLVKVYEF